MIDILLNKYVPPFPKNVECDCCGSYLRLNSAGDINTVKNKVTKKLEARIWCPCCKNHSTFKTITIDFSASEVIDKYFDGIESDSVSSTKKTE